MKANHASVLCLLALVATACSNDTTTSPSTTTTTTSPVTDTFTSLLALHGSTSRSFVDDDDRRLANIGDLQGLGGSSARTDEI